MSSSTSTLSNFEILPDEILLLVCRYLSSPDILFSFYGLNTRLSQTIDGFCRHVVLAEVPLKQFNYICKSILPNIGNNINSLVVSNNWKGVLSKVFLNFFGEKMSLTFPHLKHLILATFRIGSLMFFLDCLQDLPELFELKIHSLHDVENESNEREILLHRIFTANNNRLTSIIFDDHSLSFSYMNKNDIGYPHVEKLIIALKSLNDLHQLLTVLPGLKYIDIAISHRYCEVPAEIEHIPILTIQHFRFRSFVYNCNLDELVLIFKRIPNVKELILQISTHNDTRLIDGQQIFSYISSLSLTKFSYFLQFDDLSSFDETNILSSWQQFNQKFVCIKSDDKNDTVVLFTLPLDCPYLFVRCSTAKNKIFSDNYGCQIKCLALYDVSKQIAETFSCISKCRRMETLILRVKGRDESKSVQQTKLNKLPHLTFFVALEKPSIDADDFRRLFEMSPNLYHLAVNYEFIQPMFDNEPVCFFLQYRITHLLIGITSTTSLESVTGSVFRLTSVFPSLKHLYFHIKLDNQSAESLILSIFNQLCNWNSLVSFGVANITMDSKILSNGLREWVVENSFLTDKDSFLTDYSAETFRIWL